MFCLCTKWMRFASTDRKTIIIVLISMSCPLHGKKAFPPLLKHYFVNKILDFPSHMLTKRYLLPQSLAWVYICNSRSWDLKFQIWDDPELHNQLQDRPDWIEKHQQTKKSNKIFYKIWIKIIQMNITDICTIICSHPNVVVLYKIFKITISIMLKFTISYLTKFIKILKLYSGGFQYQRL